MIYKYSERFTNIQKDSGRFGKIRKDSGKVHNEMFHESVELLAPHDLPYHMSKYIFVSSKNDTVDLDG